MKGSWVKPGAAVIDVGVSQVDGELVGDVDFEAVLGIAASSPPSRGIGPMTITMLLHNTLDAYEARPGMSTPRRTPLHDVHRRLGARMVEFAGFEMPVQYSSIVEEHAAVREAAGCSTCPTWGRSTSRARAPWRRPSTWSRAPWPRSARAGVRYGLLCNGEGGVVDDVDRLPGRRRRALPLRERRQHREGPPLDLDHARRVRASRTAARTTGLLALQGPAERRLWCAGRRRWTGRPPALPVRPLRDGRLPALVSQHRLHRLTRLRDLPRGRRRRARLRGAARTRAERAGHRARRPRRARHAATRGGLSALRTRARRHDLAARSGPRALREARGRRASSEPRPSSDAPPRGTSASWWASSSRPGASRERLSDRPHGRRDRRARDLGRTLSDPRKVDRPRLRSPEPSTVGTPIEIVIRGRGVPARIVETPFVKAGAGSS